MADLTARVLRLSKTDDQAEATGEQKRCRKFAEKREGDSDYGSMATTATLVQDVTLVGGLLHPPANVHEL
jgi:hypothetical protein